MFVVAEGRPGVDIHETGADRKGFVRRGVQGHRQADDAGGGHQDNRPGGS